jgi:hypothetical protein
MTVTESLLKVLGAFGSGIIFGLTLSEIHRIRTETAINTQLLLLIQKDLQSALRLISSEDLSDSERKCLEWTFAKDDVEPHELFDLHENGGSAGRAESRNTVFRIVTLC